MILSHDEFLKLPVITLKGLEGNNPTDYSPFQLFLYPYLDQMIAFWWVCFAGALLVLLTRFFIIPLATNQNRKLDLSCPPIVTNPIAAKAFEGASDSQWDNFIVRYKKIFSLEEIEQDVALRLYGGAILLGYLLTFETWQMSVSTTVDAIAQHTSMCWPFFQACRDLIWMRTLPYGYSQTVFFMGLFGLIILGTHSLLKRRIVLTHACVLALFVAKIYLMLISIEHNGNYDYYHNLFSIIFLFLPQKRFFGSLMVVWFYFLSTAAKIHPSWVWGAYFNSMKDGLPLIPRGWEPFFTNLVIFMEMLMAWFMFSKNKILQRSVFAFFCFFHMYSGTLVGFHYPAIVTPSLVIFFGTLFRPFNGVPLSKSAMPGWIVIASLLLIQMYSHTIPGDTKLTLEGDYYGLYMFEANHQCRVTLANETGSVLDERDSVVARYRCDPWHYLTRAQQRYCSGEGKPTVKFSMIHSVNGGPFYKIIDEPDLCSLHYKAFGRNSWIKDENAAPMVGRPLENFYR